MILHIITDSIFPEKGIENFKQATPEKQTTLIVSGSNDFKYLKNKPDIIIEPNRWYLNFNFIKEIRNSNALVLHGLTCVGIVATFYAKKNTKILWIGWGYDYYDLFAEKGYELFGLLTSQLQSRKYVKAITSDPQKIQLKKRIKEWFHKYVLKRINYFSPVIFEDFELFVRYFPKINMSYLPWNYGGSPSTKSLEVEFLSLGPNILVGNSASFTSNHLEVFEILKQIDLGERKIIVPLSYGSPEYRDYIVKVGKELFADAFVPLLNFMPIEEYHEILQSCSIAIMNHYRQQAVGNIAALIQSGAKVYLSERNPFVKTCKRIGVKVFLVEDLEKDSSFFYHPLTESEKEINYSCFIAEFNQEKIIHQTKILIDNLL